MCSLRRQHLSREYLSMKCNLIYEQRLWPNELAIKVTWIFGEVTVSYINLGKIIALLAEWANSYVRFLRVKNGRLKLSETKVE